ncbi:MAG: SH3 domain-containing protein, partial [Bacteroidota bacterium]
MMNKLFFLLFSTVLIGCQSGESSKVLDNIRKEYAPDKRVALLNISPIFSAGKVELEGETNLPQAKAELIESYRSLGLKVIDHVKILPSPTLQGKHFGIVNVSVSNMRSNPKTGELPDHDLELSTQAILGTPLRVLKDTAGFYLVQTPDDYLGWLDDGGFTLMDSAAYQNWMQSERAVCLEDYVFAYEQPDEKSQKVSDLVAGSILQVVESQGNFIKIRFPDGRLGYVPAGKMMPLEQWLA